MLVITILNYTLIGLQLLSSHVKCSFLDSVIIDTNNGNELDGTKTDGSHLRKSFIRNSRNRAFDKL